MLHTTAKYAFLCGQAVLTCDSAAKHWKHWFSLAKNGKYPEGPLCRLSLVGLQNSCIRPSIYRFSFKPCIYPCTDPSIIPCIMHPSLHLSIIIQCIMYPFMHRSIHQSILPCFQRHTQHHINAETLFTICDGWRVGIVHSNVIVTATAVTATRRSG